MTMPQRLPAKILRDEGYLAEANRQFFHPLGLAVAVVLEADTVCVLDDRSDPEGWYMPVDDADTLADLLAKKARIEQLADERAPARFAALGYWVQPLEDQDDGPVIPRPSRPDACPELVYLGPEGEDIVAYGHIDSRLFVCLAMSLWTRDNGVGTPCSAEHSFDLSDDLFDSVQHLWMVDDVADLGGPEPEPIVRWVDEGGAWVAHDTPGAFPVTRFLTEG